METVGLSEQQQRRLRVCENHRIRRIAGVKRVERRRTKDLREERTKACIVGTIGWTHGLNERRERLPNRSETKQQEGCRKRGRPQLRWEECVKRDLRKAEEKRREGQRQGPMEIDNKSSRTAE